MFPAERYGAGGDAFEAKAYHVDPTKPIGNNKEAWEAARLHAAKILRGEASPSEDSASQARGKAGKVAPLTCRFHDFRHTAVSWMLNAGVPLAKMAKIVGSSGAAFGTRHRMALTFATMAVMSSCCS